MYTLARDYHRVSEKEWLSIIFNAICVCEWAYTIHTNIEFHFHQYEIDFKFITPMLPIPGNYDILQRNEWIQATSTHNILMLVKRYQIPVFCVFEVVNIIILYTCDKPSWKHILNVQMDNTRSKKSWTEVTRKEQPKQKITTVYRQGKIILCKPNPFIIWSYSK